MTDRSRDAESPETRDSRFDAFRDFVDDADFAGNASRVASGFWPKLRRVIGRVPFAEDAVAAWFCALDSETPLRVRGLLLAALAYFVLPFDLVPDMILGIGFGDDLTVIISTVTLLAGNIKPRHREAARRVLSGEEEMTPRGATRAAEKSDIRPDADMRARVEDAEVVDVRGGEGI